MDGDLGGGGDGDGPMRDAGNNILLRWQVRPAIVCS